MNWVTVQYFTRYDSPHKTLGLSETDDISSRNGEERQIEARTCFCFCYNPTPFPEPFYNSKAHLTVPMTPYLAVYCGGSNAMTKMYGVSFDEFGGFSPKLGVLYRKMRQRSVGH